MTHILTPAQLERVAALWTQRQRIDEVLQFFLTYIAAETGMPTGVAYNLSADLTTLTSVEPPKEV